MNLALVRSYELSGLGWIDLAGRRLSLRGVDSWIGAVLPARAPETTRSDRA
jgi:hypothetical protein